MQQAQIERAAQVFSGQLAANAVTGHIQWWGKGGDGAHARNHSQNPAADPAFTRQADFVVPVPRGVIQAIQGHFGEDWRHVPGLHRAFSGNRIDAAIGQGCPHDHQVMAGDRHGTLAGVDGTHLHRVGVHIAVTLQQPGNAAVVLVGLGFGLIHLVVDCQAAPGEEVVGRLDLVPAGLRNNTLFEHMDVIFDNFNSATGYSGPAALRLLRASCGQSPHSQLYTSADKECLLFDDLRQLGFSEELMLNHNGEYGGFLQAVREQGHLPAPALGVTPPGLQRAYVGFDSSPIWRDRDVLSAWWQHRMAEDTPQIALFYNTVTLHDGNRQVLPDGGTQSASYKSRAQKLLDDLDSFLTELKKSGRRVAVIIVPEHGAALHGDRMQIAGMREIPSQAITHVPVGIKLINMGDNDQETPIHVTEPTSYMAIAEIIARLYADPQLSSGNTIDWSRLLSNLPQTAKVSENSGTTVLEYNDKPYVRIKEDGAWLPYPQQRK